MLYVLHILFIIYSIDKPKITRKKKLFPVINMTCKSAQYYNLNCIVLKFYDIFNLKNKTE
jgi:hypothetical protein